MSRHLIFALVVTAAVPAAVFAKPSAPETLRRTGNWVVNYDNDSCHLLAQFGMGDNALVMRFTRYQPGDRFDFSLYGRRLASDAIRSEASVDFGLRDKPIKTETMNGKTANLPLMIFGSLRLDGRERKGPEDTEQPLSPEQEGAVSGATVKIERKKPFRLAFGSLSKPMEQLRKCEADLLKTWGYDPVVQTTLAKPARPVTSPTQWLRASDYPSGAIMMGQSGIVQFRLDVDAAGAVAGCHVLARTSPDVFADTTCRIVTRRAKLEPALDANGTPVRSFYVQKVSWRMGE